MKIKTHLSTNWSRVADSPNLTSKLRPHYHTVQSEDAAPIRRSLISAASIVLVLGISFFLRFTFFWIRYGIMAIMGCRYVSEFDTARDFKKWGNYMGRMMA